MGGEEERADPKAPPLWELGSRAKVQPRWAQKHYKMLTEMVTKPSPVAGTYLGGGRCSSCWTALHMLGCSSPP